MKIAFIHPDLGIGGAERLVIDAAVGLQSLGHEVVIYTSHCDKNHCFDEARDGTLKVVVRGDRFVPPKLYGRFSILCSILRQLHLCYNLIHSPEGLEYDVFIVDQLSACVPFIRRNLPGRILFYCHFPDQLLTQRQTTLKRLYRIPFDRLESWSTDKADVIVVNSNFTRGVFRSTFRNIKRVPEVVYPCVNTQPQEPSKPNKLIQVLSAFKVILSINRFERKKDIALAIKAFSIAIGEDDRLKNAKLILAGGYDSRVEENVEYLRELILLCREHKLTDMVLWPDDKIAQVEQLQQDVYESEVIFLPSVSEQLKSQLLQHTLLLTYTPEYEHFGIVPLEAMFAGKPVLSCNNGGPLETVVDGKTGWNRSPVPSEWAQVIKHVLTHFPSKESEKIAVEAKKWVISQFSKEKMAEQFEYQATQSLKVKRQDIEWFNNVLLVFRALYLTIFAMIMLVLMKMFIAK